MIRKRHSRLLACLMILAMLCTMLPTAALAAEGPSGGEVSVTDATYSVTVDSAITGGSIAVNPASGSAGDTITVSVTPDSGKQLVAGSLQYTPEGGTATGIIDSGSGYSFVLPAADVVVNAQFEDISAATYNIAVAAVPDAIWTVTPDMTSATVGETVSVTVSDTAFTSWATGLIVTGDSGTTYDFTTITAATGNANNVNGAGVYSFVMPDEPVTVGFTADYTPLDVYIQYGTAGEEIPVHSYTRAEMEALAAENTTPIHYAMYDRLPAVFMGKAVRYVSIDQLAASAATYNSAVRFDGPDCSLRGASLDGWTLGVNGLSWEYLMGQTRKYYAGIGDQYLAQENRTGQDCVVPAVLAITGWAGRQAQVDNQPYDTLNAYRLFYGQSEAEYGGGVLPTTNDDKNARSTANNSAKCVNKVVFVVPEDTPATYYAVNFSVTGEHGTLAAAVDSAAISSGDTVAAGKTVIFTASPAEGYQVKQWTLNGQAVADNKTNTLTVENLAAAQTVTVEFEAISEPGSGNSISISSATCNPGGSVALTLSFTATVPILGAQAKLQYDASKLTFTSVDPGAYYCLDCGSAPGQAYFCVVHDEGVITTFDAGTYTATLHFTAAPDADGEYPLTFIDLNSGSGTMLMDESFTLLEMTTTNGAITVSSDGEPQPATYAVTVDSAITGGTVAVAPTTAAAGDTVTVTVTPDEGKQLAAGSLKYTADGGNTYTVINATEGVYSFTLPAANVVVTAEFADIPAAPTVWDGSVDVSWYNTTDTVFYINTPAQLAGLAAIVNGTYNTGATVIGNPSYIVCNVGGGSVKDATSNTWIYGADDFDGKTVYLTADLDMGGVYNASDDSWSGPNYMPIGGQYCMTYQDGTTLIGASWNGTFDGQGHTVKNIYCSRHAGTLGYAFSQAIGLIGRMGVHDDDPREWYASPSVKNVAVSGYIYANRSVGGIVGKNGKSNGSLIENCVNYASVSNTDSKGVGGIAGAGWNGLTIRNCANLGSIYTSYENAGGISGSCEAKVFDSYNVGYVGASSPSQAQSLGTNNLSAVWTNCYWLDGSSASNQAVYGSTTGSTITKMETADSMKTADFLAALNGDGRAWAADTANVNNGYPIPRIFITDTSTLTGISKESDPAKLSYAAGETFDPAGLVIWAHYSDGTREKITDYTISKTTALETTDTSITISGACGGVPYSYDFPITVESNVLANIIIAAQPTNTLYFTGQTFDPTGMVVRAEYSSGSVDLTADQYSISPAGALTPADSKVIISYTDNGVTVTAEQQITVLPEATPALAGDYYELSTPGHMLWFANQVNNGVNPAIKGKLMDNIDLSQTDWKPIGFGSSNAFTGIFDGNGKTVTVAINSSEDYIGLFGNVQDGAVKELTVAGSVSGNKNTAGIVACARGAVIIQNCVNNAAITGAANYVGGVVGYIFANADVSITGCVNNGSVTGSYNVGGVAGYGNGVSIISNCANTGAVSATSDSTSSNHCVGGIIGSAYKATTMNQCYNSGEVTGSVPSVGGIAGYLHVASSVLTNSYNTGQVTNNNASATAHTGGIAGYSDIEGITVRNCYNAGIITAVNTGDYTAAIIGYAKDNANVGNNYYLDGTASKGLGYATDNTVGKTSGEIKSVEFLPAINSTGRSYVADAANINSGYPVLRIQIDDTAVFTNITKEADPRLTYVEGETFDDSALEIWANYSDGTREKITAYTVSKTTALAMTDASIIVSGDYHGTDFSYDFPITVEANALASIAVTTPPNNLLYCAGETFDPTGIVVTAVYTNGSQRELSSEAVTVNPSVLSVGDTAVTISYTEAGLTKTVAQPVKVITSAPALDSNNVYELSTVDHMLWFANQVNTGLNKAVNGKLMNDIDLSGMDWTPIGISYTVNYGGVFDGNGKTVSLSIANDSANYLGLFGYLSGATVKNVTVEGSVTGSAFAAGIVGYAIGTATIENCVNQATITGNSSNIGGIVGYIKDDVAVTDCINTGNVTGTYYVGGIVGYYRSTGAISGCANIGGITATSTDTTHSYGVGGVVGYAYDAGTIDQCYNAGVVKGGVMSVGGVVGYMQNAAAVLRNAYNTGSVTSENTSDMASTGGVVGYTNNAGCTVQNCYNAGAITVSNSGAFTAGVIGYATGNTNVSNNYYLNSTASIGLGYTTDNAISKTSDELKALASTLGESFKAGSVYPILVWQDETPTTVPVTGVTLDKTSVTLTPGSTDQLTPTVSPADATSQTVAWSSDNTAVATVSDSGLVTAIAPGTANITVTTADGGFTATCSVAVNSTTVQGKYTVTPVTDEATYQIGATEDGISIMTVNEGVAGMKYFSVQVAPVEAHEGPESAVFVHLRNGVQQSMNVTRADLDAVSTTQAGFNVQAGDVVKSFIVDELTNSVNSNPTILQ